MHNTIIWWTAFRGVIFLEFEIIYYVSKRYLLWLTAWRIMHSWTKKSPLKLPPWWYGLIIMIHETRSSLVKHLLEHNVTHIAMLHGEIVSLVACNHLICIMLRSLGKIATIHGCMFLWILQLWLTLHSSYLCYWSSTGRSFVMWRVNPCLKNFDQIMVVLGGGTIKYFGSLPQTTKCFA